MRSATPWIVALVIVCLLPARPMLAAPQYGAEWTDNALGNVYLIANLSPDPGLEAVAMTPLAELHLFRLSDEHDLGALPSPFTVLTTFYPRDIDGDNLAELVCVLVDQQINVTTIGCIEVAGGAIVRKWPDIGIDAVVSDVEFMDISPTEPSAIVTADSHLRIFSSQSGATLYNSSSDIGTGWKPLTVLIDDFDGDGREEVLATFSNGGPPPYRTALIGDLSATTGVQSISGVSVGQIRPNPMSSGATVAYTLSSPEVVKLQVFDTAGRLVRTLENQRMATGQHQTSWNGRDDAGSAVAAGMYFIELDVAGKTTTRKLVRLK